ncbi:type III pantothenate kinase [Rhodanobacter sp. 7MK24]|uniref:type III pantothenate kinase n=1 Tax=Rhodanobacter sp. 7MK24 TaxID=2775922 RepID=UPI0017868340|nr:type III pantothenate kinase [Rhodanobacter sp. 7MK24]MBD8881595.1 type III pantothenate kinase [Rhodanobacter sp. 7MK24]
MKLLLDLGNTRLKWALHRGTDVLAGDAVAWNESVAEALAASWAGLAPPSAIFGASVVDAAREQLVAASATAAFGREPWWLRTPAEACGVRNAYAEPQRLGVDRFLAMVAARAEGSAPCILAGVGTALTLDALAADGRHLGGLIAPGPRLMQQSLLGATAQVRPAHAGTIVEVADNTADAVASGCWLAAAALVGRFAAHMSPALGGAPSLRLGGGDAEALLPLLATPAQLVHDNVLRGLAAWAAAQ